MFTGLVEEVGTITQIETIPSGSKLTIGADVVVEGLQQGNSVAIDGVCMTAIEIHGSEFVIEVSPETIVRSNFALYQIGTQVNLERPLSAAGRSNRRSLFTISGERNRQRRLCRDRENERRAYGARGGGRCRWPAGRNTRIRARHRRASRIRSRK